MSERITRANVDRGLEALAREMRQALALECQHGMPGLYFKVTTSPGGRVLFRAHGKREAWQKMWDAVEVLRAFKRLS